MSHLPLDARAILEYLNELGYRNISAEQLKEFMKGMQRHSEINSSKGKQQQKPKGSSSNYTQQQQQQQQQQQHQKQQTKLPSTTRTTPTTTTSATGATKARPSSPKPQQQQQQRTPVKIIKSKKPLWHFKFYLDICDHQLAKKIEIRIKQLGGTQQFFLTPSVTHFITDKTVLPPNVGNNNNTLSSRPGTPQTPLTPGTPQTPYSHESHIIGDGKNNATSNITTISTATTPSDSRKVPIRQTRADAILNRARRGQSSTSVSVASPIGTKQSTDVPPTSIVSTKCSPKVDNNSNQNQPYVIWQAEQALRFFAKVQHDLKDYLTGTTRERKSHSSKSSGAFGPTNLKGSFIKIESLKRNYRPYYQLFKKPTEWPKIELTREDGAFRLSPKKELEVEEKRMTRKSRSRSSQRQHVLPAQVQSLKKNETGVKSSAGQKVGSNAAGTCKQAKETSEKQCGVCEICKIEYDTLTIHLKTKDHEYFAKNSQNFIALDTLIQTSADVNKFLKEDNSKPANTMELEEMEVEEQEAQSEDDVAQDPLEDHSHRKGDIKRCSNGSANDTQCNSPSPGVRERSKRITKGKHSSEKFQHSKQRTSSKSPKSAATPKSNSPKKPTALSVNTTTANAVSHSNTSANEESPTAVVDNVISPGVVTRKKQATVTAVYSPPMRAMLPPSSMYKVVDTIQDTGTPQRKLQGTELAVGSPSIIVKFKKVRQPELCRLSGEADSFMFRKQRTSSELPTDLDRQTTSDHVRANNSAASSISLDSSVNDSICMELESEKTDSCAAAANATSGLNKKAIAIAKRRKGKVPLVVKNKEQNQKTTKTATPSNKQRFPAAPIQPEVQLKNLRRGKSTTDVTATKCTEVPNFEHTTRRLTVPEATRKSSRTATAIVTAATTSSRLLRAAVEAAKKASTETGVMTSRSTIASTVAQPVTQRVNDTSKVVSTERPAGKLTRSSRLSVVRMEDRMGDSGPLIARNDSNSSHVSRAKRSNAKKICPIQIEDDEDEDDDEDDDDDDEDDGDEDFILNSNVRIKPVTCIAKTEASPAATREERAARRWNQRLQSLDIPDFLAGEMLAVDVEYEPPKRTHYGRRRVATKVCSPRAKKSQCDSKQVEDPITIASKKVILTSPPQRVFDISKSERIPKQHYAFERLPVTDLWYRVYTRQDTCGERYFEYYGSKNYRKLPYEMGPIPFDFTLTGNAAHCSLCQKSGKVNAEPKKAEEKSKITCDKKIKLEDQAILEGSKVSEKQQGESNGNSEQQKPAQAVYTHKHKKLHLLQRYRQEQHQLLLQKQKAQQQDAFSEHSSNLNVKCDSKGSTPEREADRERAGSTHSNTSSCTASSTGTFNSKKKYRNKLLNKAAFLSLELPPRKSPREHASTLALVSCIIRQRQDSMSKTNSETDEPATQALGSPRTSLPPLEEDLVESKPRTPVKEEKPPTPVMLAEVRSPRATRSAAATPVEELRFATEISENVKRMRRGQNKYDHSPPIVLKTRPSRGKCKKSPVATSPLDRRSFKALGTAQVSSQNTIKQDRRRRPRSLLLPTKVKMGRSRLGRPPKIKSSLPSVRKTGSKKGVLEFEMDTAALRALKTVMAPQRSTHQLEWEIDKFLDITAKEYDFDEMEDLPIAQPEASQLPVEITSNKPFLSPSSSSSTTKSKKASTIKSTLKLAADYAENTPPPTDYFSSDFDLYDLFTSSNANGTGSDEDQFKPSSIGNLSLYSSVALQNYFRKRKSLKSNRTGWPKAQKKKPSLKQHGLRQKIRFLHKIEQSSGVGNRDTIENINIKAEVNDDAVSTQGVVSMNGERSNRQNSDSGNRNGVITPPDSEPDDTRTLMNGDYGEEGNGDEEYLDAIDDTELEVGGNECITGIDEAADDEDDGETMADSIEIERCEMDMDGDIDAAAEADIEADADEEDDDDDEEDDDDDDDDVEIPAKRVALDNDLDIDDETTTMYMEQRSNKRLRRSTDVTSPSALKHMGRNSLHPDTASTTVSLTSTPTTTTATANMLRGLRRTPVLLNGSLGSCISPSEKAGDNSDIFTVSSDGLDTDLDLSNSHSQYRTGDDEQQPQETSCPHRTPKRKYDISKYAPNSKNSRTCAAEAATAAVKSLAISQFLKKEVRVTCRRLRPPFRRFRFRLGGYTLVDFKNLRKLIKYEEGLGVNIHQDDYFQNLYKRTTASYRAKIDEETVQRKQRERNITGKKHYPCASKENVKSIETVYRRPSAKPLHELQKDNTNDFRKNEKHVSLSSKTAAVFEAKLSKSNQNKRLPYMNADDVLKFAEQSRAKKEVAVKHDRRLAGMQKLSLGGIQPDVVDKKDVAVQQDGLSTRTVTAQSSRTVIIPRSKPQKRKTLANDPVALYHYYQNEWKHFEKQIPGNDSRADLRWQIRNKLK